MADVYLFTGENRFALRKEKERWVAQFASRHGTENLLSVDAPQTSARALMDDVATAPFIAGKRLVMVRGVPKSSAAEMEALLDSVHPDCVLLFVDAAPDRRTAGVKTLLSRATVKEFRPVKGKQLREWMQRYAREQGVPLEASAEQELLALVGDDQDMLASEIEKLALTAGSAITLEQVSVLAVPSGEQEVWRLSSFIAQGDLAGSLRTVRSLLAQGETPMSVWHALLWILRSLGAVVIAKASGERDASRIASTTSLHPLTVRTLLPLASRITLPQMSQLMDWLVAADVELKTGGLRSSEDSPQEVASLIDELLIRCCMSPSSSLSLDLLQQRV